MQVIEIPRVPGLPATLTPEQYSSYDVALRLRQQQLDADGIFWNKLGSFAQATLTTLTLVGIVGAWWATGKLMTPKKGKK